ncbi:MAG: GNAT family N-acetyltransferase [Kouleothrix sp.]|nr:GNAT family N-acetyltransferase [Kouleothrix sp.]
MDRQALLAAYDHELRVAIEPPGMRKEALPQLVRLVRPAPGMSSIRYSRLDPAQIDAAIQEQIAYFAPARQPFEWSVYEHDQPPDLADRLVAAGFAPDDPTAVMALDLRHAPATLLAPTSAELRPIVERDQLGAVLDVMEQVWGGQFGWITQRMGDHLLIPGYLSIYVAYVDERPACAGWVYFHPGSQFASLYGGSTLPQHRGRGLYTAVLARRAQEAIARGYRYLTIDAGPMSRPIVASHGFELLTTVRSFEWQGYSDGQSAEPSRQ